MQGNYLIIYSFTYFTNFIQFFLRRFRAAQERTEQMAKAAKRGDEVDESAIFDSNCITPGTEFMELVSKHLRWFIRSKMKNDPIWKNLEVIYSGHDVPGEGEHKIMQYIREERSKPGYSPNVKHCMYGGDADLIMLGLATHEPFFTLLREVVDFNAFKNKNSRQVILKQTKEANFQLMHLSVLREYLEIDLALECTWEVDRERLYDDFILLTFLVGNDFLPHLPTLDIGEHAFDILFTAYRELLNELPPGYLVCNGDIVDFPRLELLFKKIGSQERDILANREVNEMSFKESQRKRRGRGKGMSAVKDTSDEDEAARQLEYENALNHTFNVGEIVMVPSYGRGQVIDIRDSDEMHVVSLLNWKLATGKAPLVYALATSLVKIKEAPMDEKKEIDSLHTLFLQSSTSKDYRGRYYFEKFKIIPGTSKRSVTVMNTLMECYLQGLIWCLAYYVKGCISWTWYFPFHYGPMLQDMTSLGEIASRISFSLGAPFKPFQQLLGCLPPASKNMLPRSYQWLMINATSPLIQFYPIQFNIDMNGKRNPWEAVVLLPFIDERILLSTEAEMCPESSLNSEEIARNTFGKVLHFHYDPNEGSTYFSCNPEIGLPDVNHCQTTVSYSIPSLAPGAYFKAEEVPGTAVSLPGFPSLTVLEMDGVDIEFIKLNIFGSESKYKSLVLSAKKKDYDVSKLNLKALLGRYVYVNYPQVHEAKVVAVTVENQEIRLAYNKDTNEEEIKVTPFDYVTQQKWKKESGEMETGYLKGRGIPGSGGLDIGDVHVRVRVLSLQGMRRDPSTGATKKVFGTTEADIPLQLVLWKPPVVDTRFQETAELPVHQLFPHGCEVVAVTGQLIGCMGTVIGPHTADDNTSRSSLAKEPSDSKGKRVVDVEFQVSPPEPPFGYAITHAIRDEYFSSRDVCAVLGISSNLLGMIVGTLVVDNGMRIDIGLNLKRNHNYQLLGYVRKVDTGEKESSKSTIVWGGEGQLDSVLIVGSVESVKHDGEAEAAIWEYSARTIALIIDYMVAFPTLFKALRDISFQKSYRPTELFGGSEIEANEKLEEVVTWLKAQSFYNMHRTPLSTTMLSKEAIRAIEIASDARVSNLATSGQVSIVVKGIPVESVFRGDISAASDAPLLYNTKTPALGDRVVNLNSTGVPFGLKGTVSGIHAGTGYVEVVFDEEFVGGRSLQGMCSQFRGRLCPWSGLIKTSLEEDEAKFKKVEQIKKAYAQRTAPAVVAPPAAAIPIKTSEVSKDASEKLKSLLKKPVNNKDVAASVPAAKGNKGGKKEATKVDKSMSKLLKDKLNITDSTTAADTNNAVGLPVPPTPEQYYASQMQYAQFMPPPIPMHMMPPPLPAPVAIAKNYNFEDDGLDLNAELKIDPNTKSDGTGRKALQLAAGLTDDMEEIPHLPPEFDPAIDGFGFISFPMPMFRPRPGEIQIGSKSLGVGSAAFGGVIADVKVKKAANKSSNNVFVSQKSKPAAAESNQAVQEKKKSNAAAALVKMLKNDGGKDAAASTAAGITVLAPEDVAASVVAPAGAKNATSAASGKSLVPTSTLLKKKEKVQK